MYDKSFNEINVCIFTVPYSLHVFCGLFLNGVDLQVEVRTILIVKCEFRMND